MTPQHMSNPSTIFLWSLRCRFLIKDMGNRAKAKSAKALIAAFVRFYTVGLGGSLTAIDIADVHVTPTVLTVTWC